MDLRSGFTLGEWSVYPLEGRLSGAAGDRRVQPKSMEVLLCLAEVGGEVVERDTLLRRVWGNAAVTDEPLTRCIGELRRALGDRRADPAYILTIPKRGYRLLKAAEALTQPPAGAPAAHVLRRIPMLVAGLLALIVIGVLAFYFLRTPQPVPAEPAQIARDVVTRSIAVLPFSDMSERGDQEYMSDGVAEELLNLLARIPELRVISRTSAFAFKGQALEATEIARRLDVAYLLEGSVRTSGQRIRITAQLIDARTDTHLWSRTFDREMQDVFAIQDEIASQVVDELELTLLSDAPLTRQTDPDAYALFLQARYLHEHTGGDSFQRAFDYYEAALEIDANYVPAWVWLAALYDDTVNSSELPREEVGRLARDAIERALAIDPDDPLALGMSSILLDAWDNDLQLAAKRMRKALTRDPNNPILLRWAAILLSSLGRNEEAVQVAEYLFERDPIGSISMVNLASLYLMSGRTTDAIRICEIELALSRQGSPCESRLIVAHVYAGEAESAFDALQKVSGSRVHLRLAPMVWHALGDRAQYAAALEALQTGFENGDTGLAYWLGRTLLLAGDRDGALRWFEAGADAGTLNVAPTAAYYRELRGDQRWNTLLQRLGRTPESLGQIELAVRLPGS